MSELIAALKLIKTLISGLKNRKLATILIDSSPHESKFLIPSSNENDYPEKGRDSLIKLDLKVTITAYDDFTIHGFRAFIVDHNFLEMDDIKESIIIPFNADRLSEIAHS